VDEFLLFVLDIFDVGDHVLHEYKAVLTIYLIIFKI